MDAALSQEVLLDHFKNPRHRGAVGAPGFSGAGVNPACGDRVRVTAAVEDGRLAVKVEGAGCVVSQASASMMAQSLQGRPLDEAGRFARSVRDWLSGRGERPDVGGDVEALAGVRRHPARAACACLAWTVFLDSVERK